MFFLSFTIHTNTPLVGLFAQTATHLVLTTDLRVLQPPNFCVCKPEDGKWTRESGWAMGVCFKVKDCCGYFYFYVSEYQ